VADLTHEIADDGFHEIHLSGKQLVFLFMATTVVSIVIFLCGVLVGRGVRAQQPADALADPAASATAAPTASQAVAEAGPTAAEPPAPPAEGDELSYRKRLEGETARRESLPPAPAPEPVREAPAPPREAPAREPEARSARQQPAGPPPSAVTGTPQPGTWVLQVHALRDQKVASSIVQRLAKKGYPAFLVAAGPPSNMFRVFVGRYKDRDEAERVAARLKKEEQFIPWITR
jgi:cell division septation protein DedD